MPWKECSSVSEREEFVELAAVESANISLLCRGFGISRKTGYKWLGRYESAGSNVPAGRVALWDRTRRPQSSPARTCEAMEAAVLRVRVRHPAWGGRKIRRVLMNDGHVDVPSASTITAILHRHGLISREESSKRKAWIRFERRAPNDLWQMDFKGHFALADRRCHPLTVLDDHSRYCIGLQACVDEQRETVRSCLTDMFRSYGLPRQLLMDNGPPWGGDRSYPWTKLTAWLIQLGIGVSHGRPYHPQTQGKEERFHRTLKAEVLNYHRHDSFPAYQKAFDHWRSTYNLRRPHEALDLDTPVSRYAVSPRAFPEALRAPCYGCDDEIRKVQHKGELHFRSEVYVVGRAFRGHRVALRQANADGVWDVYFYDQQIARVDQRTGTCVCERRGWEASEASARQASVRSAHSGPAGEEVFKEQEKT